MAPEPAPRALWIDRMLARRVDEADSETDPALRFDDGIEKIAWQAEDFPPSLDYDGGNGSGLERPWLWGA